MLTRYQATGYPAGRPAWFAAVEDLIPLVAAAPGAVVADIAAFPRSLPAGISDRAPGR